MRRLGSSFLLLALLGGASASAEVPDGYEDNLVATLPVPGTLATVLTFTPDGRLLVGRQTGEVNIIDATGVLLTTQTTRIPTCGGSERGLLGIAVDPDFTPTANNFIYTYYSRGGGPTCDNRVSRWTLLATNVIDPASEVVLIDHIPAVGWIHNAGDVHFGKDGYLYVSVGDAGCDIDNDTICGGGNNNARDRHTLLGKILRITRTGGIPPDNPFVGPGTVRCQFGNGPAGSICQEAYAWGLRNPFRFAMDPGAAGVRFFINDVGQNGREEINLGQRGADYGWNCFEGDAVNSNTGPCSPTPPDLVFPIFQYSHLTGCSAITGAAFLPSGSWPSDLDGSYFYGDYVCGKMFRLVQGSGGTYTSTEFATDLGVGTPVHMRFGPLFPLTPTSPPRPGLGLYYTSLASGAAVRVIEFVGTGNRSPVALMFANPTSGPVPLIVTFDGSGSSDPDGDPLTYHWNFGDGSPEVETTSPITQHTYLAGGSYTAVLRAEDDQNAFSDPVSVVIDADNNAPFVTIDVPAAGALFRVGQNVVLHGTATDPEDGPLPPTSLTWNVRRHHATHFHPWVVDAIGNDIPMTTPQPEDLVAATNSYLEVLLTARDSLGATTTVSRIFNPRKVDVSLQSVPPGLTLKVNTVDIVTPSVVVSWDNYNLDLEAPDQSLGGNCYAFAAWSDGGARNHTFVTPATNTALTATFNTTVPAPVAVPFLAVTSRHQSNHVAWQNPTAPGFVSTTLVFRTDRFPTAPGDGTNLVTGGAPGGQGAFDHTSLVNGTTYYYGAFASFCSGGLAPGRFAKGRPFDTTVSPAKWAYSTSASLLTAPGIGLPAVLAMSQDQFVHAVLRGSGGGTPPVGFARTLLPTVVQSRPAAVPGAVSGHANVAFLGGLNNGRVYAIDADNGTQVWESPPYAEGFQGAVSGGFTGFGFPFSRLFLGTRNATGNSFLGIDPQTGNLVGAPYTGAGGVGGLGPVNASASVDYATRRVVFTSREATPGADTVWCVEATLGGFSYVWSTAVGGGVDTAPVIRGDRVYVGGLDGLVYALDKADGSVEWSFTPPGSGNVKGFVFPDRFGAGLYFANDNRVVGISDDGTSASPLFDAVMVPSPSVVLFKNAEGGQPARLYFGTLGVPASAPGRLVELDLSQSPPTQRFVELGIAPGVPGPPTYDNITNMIYVGSEEGILYGVAAPLPPP